MTRAFKDHISIPEKFGTVMVIEKEFGPSGAKDWAGMAKSIVNIVKVTFGTAALYDEKLLKEKIAVYNDAGISTMIGGTLTEVAILNVGGYTRSALKGYLDYAKGLGFTHLEFSDGSIFIPDKDRGDLIRMIKDAGFQVISEVGKKEPKKDALITTSHRIELMKKGQRRGFGHHHDRSPRQEPAAEHLHALRTGRQYRKRAAPGYPVRGSAAQRAAGGHHLLLETEELEELSRVRGSA
jgi:phosphosulfolactate synthase (CoM biosynthesis protein A)